MRRRLVALGFSLALASAWMSMRPAVAGQDTRIRGIDTKNFPIVAVTVSVQGSSKLSPGDFRVIENDVPVPVASVRPLGPSSDRGIDVVLAIDTSDSMRGAPLETAFAAARAFVQQVPPWINIGLVTFSDRPAVVQSMTSDHAAVLSTLASVPSTTLGTSLFDGVATASRMFSGTSQRNIILLTDGRNTTGTADLGSAVTAARRAHATIFSVSLEGANTDVGTLQHLAKLTSGSFVSASAESLGSVYSALATELSGQYLITYRSKAPYGAQTTLRVEVPSGTADSGFLAPGPHAQGTLVGQTALERYLQGTFGVATVIGLTFLAALAAGSLLIGAQVQSRRDRQLAQLIPAPPKPRNSPAGRSERNRFTAWIPESVVGAAGRVVQYSGLTAVLDARLERAAVAMRPGEFLAGISLAGLTGAVGGALIGGIFSRLLLGALLFGALGILVPWLLVAGMEQRRTRQLQSQLPDVLMVIASSLRAGHSFLQALDMVTKEVGDPAAHEFGRAVTEIRLGRPANEALSAMATRIRSDDFEWAVMAINIQRQVGGNLAELLETVADTIRQRQTLRRQVRVLSGEGRLSVTILTVLPILLATYIFVVVPSYLQTLFQTGIGLILLAGAAVLMFIGYLWMKRIVRIDV